MPRRGLPFFQTVFRRGAFTLAALCATLSVAARAEVPEALSYAYYDVAIRPGEPLMAALQAASPLRQGDGHVFHGHTRWSVSWKFRWDRGPDYLCRMSWVKTELHTVITLPRLAWAEPARGAAMQEYVSTLHDHELGHHRNGQAAARAIDNELRSLPPMAECQLLEQEANLRGQRVLERFRALDAEYDRITDHGRRQTAVGLGE